MDVVSPVTTWIDADYAADSDAARHFLLSTLPTGPKHLVTNGQDLTRVNVPDCPTTTVGQSRPQCS